MSAMIDLSAVAAPQVVEPLSFEAVLLAIKAELLARYPGVADVIDLESEPLVKLLQVMAYREVLIRQRVNEAARSVMLAYAVGTDLDHLGANVDTPRLQGEDDTRYRQRVQQAYARLAAAGPANAYRQHALAVSADIIDVDVFSQAPGQVTVSVLARRLVHELQADPAQAAIGAVLFGMPALANHVYTPEPHGGPLMHAVLAALNADDVRPLTDHVIVRAPAVTTFEIQAVLEILPGPDAQTIKARRLQALAAYLRSCNTQGSDVTLAGITAALVEPGVKDVRLQAPLANIAIAPGQLAVCLATHVATEVVRA